MMWFSGITNTKLCELFIIHSLLMQLAEVRWNNLIFNKTEATHLG